MERCSHTFGQRTCAALLLLILGASSLFPVLAQADDGTLDSPAQSSTPIPEVASTTQAEGEDLSESSTPSTLGSDSSNILPTDIPVLGLSFLSSGIYYPQLDPQAVRGTVTPPYQTAFKDGDRTYVSAVIQFLSPVISATADVSSMGGPSALSLPTVTILSGFQSQLQSDWFTVDTSGANASTTITITAIDALGISTRVVIPVQIDNTPPQVSLFSLAFSTTTPKEGDTLLLAGSLHDSASVVGIYGVTGTLLTADDTPFIHHWNYTGSGEDIAVENLHEGKFQNIPLILREYAPGDLDDATYFRLSLLAKDAAGNTASTDFTVPVHATSTPVGTPASNVLFLPGIEQSRLYGASPSNPEEKYWEPFGDGTIRQLSLDGSGESERSDIHARVGDLVTSAPGLGDFYDSFFAELNSMKSGQLINDWVPVAYDWRLSLPDIVNKGRQEGADIYYTQGTSTPYIEQTLRQLAASSRTGKVTIIAHSNGGLVAKALMQKLGSAETSQLIDKVIFVGVPQEGAPQAVAVALFGYGQAFPFEFCANTPVIGGLCSFITSHAAARSLVENSPGEYHLLPTANYFRDVQDPAHPLISFSGDHLYQREQSAYGSTITGVSALYDYLLARELGRPKPEASDIGNANILNPVLINYAHTEHDLIDSWTPPAGVSVYQIAGWGHSTFSGLQFYQEPHVVGAVLGYKLQYRPIFTISGDLVVPAPSALMMGTASNVSRYWVNLERINNLKKHDYSHGSLLAVDELQSLVQTLVKGDSNPLPTHITETQPISTSTDQLLFILHSPLTLELEDDFGNKLGQATDGTNYEQIPGATFGQLGEVKYLLAPSGTYHLSMHGQDSGSFSLDVQEMRGDTTTASTTFADVPTTTQTLVTLSVNGSVASTSSLTVDEDGNGTPDITLAPALGETVLYTPPVITPPAPPSSVASSTQSSSTEQSSLPITSIHSAASTALFHGQKNPQAATKFESSAPSSIPSPFLPTKLTKLPHLTNHVATPGSESSTLQSDSSTQNSQTASVFSALSQQVWLKNFVHGLYHWVQKLILFIRNIL